MTIKNVYDITNFLINKHQGGFLNYIEFNNAFRLAELEHMDYLTGEFRQLQYGRPIPRIGIGMNKKITESLSPFRKTLSLNTGQYGEIGKPNNVAVVDAMNKTSDGTPIIPVQPEHLGNRLKSVVVSLDNHPVYVEHDTYWKIYPENIGSIVATIIEYPPFSKYAVTVDGTGRESYDNANSVDPIWKNRDVIEIIGRMLKSIGLHLKDGEAMQYAQSIINQGE